MVQPFEALDYDGQVGRLTDAAREALAAYGLESADLKLVMYVNNAVFRVTATDGSEYALRIHRPGHKRIEWIQSELEWLQAIHHEADLKIAVPVQRRDGGLLTSAQVEGLNEPVTGALFEWIDGQPMTWDSITLEQVQQAGTFLAGLHTFSRRFVPPQGFARPRLDWEGLFGADSPYNPGEGAAIFTPDQLEVFAQVEARVGGVMSQLGESADTFGLIHADFIVKNFLYKDDDLYVIDFDDGGWGYYLYDLAPLLTQMKGEPRYPEIYAAYWRGYTSVRPLPEGDQAQLEAFIAARHLASCRWVAGNLQNPRIRERAAEVIAHRTSELRLFLDTGAISQRGEQF
jgi:Ser/Thr protein kinase RdoA (MazF antagonist)